MSSDLINEVDEAMRKERMETMWKEYGPYIIGGAALAILITIFSVMWTNWNTKTNTAHTTALVNAMETDNVPVALEKAAGDIRPTQAAVARLTAAGMYIEDNRPVEALDQYRRAASLSGAPDLFRNLATVMQVRITPDATPEDAAPEDLLAMLQPVWSDDKSPWRYHARMQAALLHGHGLGQYEEAQSHINAILEANAIPQSLRQRAQALGHVYSLKMNGTQVNGAQTNGEGGSSQDPAGDAEG